ncbi:MAG: Toxic anion resistance family protein [candidate division CPR2 bacterium GW2011_GWC2_39_10]|uniref:Toxic anion resistance family protein n=1 Tax=candidate division CPR2 bacterium GW2011_GWC2_39_10 TaxID=1618345 RepID=A0A0G0PWV8_UNCC2|nr:MAG: Toxic anion resistance family protein [candidate division CPR2 bacterium GW2011_GWC2_39_10]
MRNDEKDLKTVETGGPVKISIAPKITASAQVPEVMEDSALEPDEVLDPNAEIVASPPKDMPVEEQNRLRGVCSELVKRLAENPDDHTVVEEASNVGIEAQTSVLRQNEALDMKMSVYQQLNREIGIKSEKDLGQLVLTFDRLRPSSIRNRWYMKALAMIPGFGSSMEDRIAAIIVSEINTVGGNIKALTDGLQSLIDRLESSKHVIVEEMVAIDGGRETLARNIYLSELLFETVGKEVRNATDPKVRDNLLDIQADIAMRVRNMRALENAEEQNYENGKIQLRTLRQNQEAIRSTKDIGGRFLQTAMRLSITLAEQQRTAKLNEQARDFINSVMLENAAGLKQNAAEVAEAFSATGIGLKQAEKAVEDIKAAALIVAQARQKAIDEFPEDNRRWKALTADLVNTSGMQKSPNIRSLEA